MSNGVGPVEVQESELSWSILWSVFLKKSTLLERNCSSGRWERKNAFMSSLLLI